MTSAAAEGRARALRALLLSGALWCWAGAAGKLHAGGDEALSPDGSAAAYFRDDALRVKDTRTGKSRVLVPAQWWKEGQYSFDPGSISWSHDGSLIAFIAETFFEYELRELWVVAHDGSGLRKVDDLQLPYRWSPAELKIAYLRNEDVGELPGQEVRSAPVVADLEADGELRLPDPGRVVGDLRWESPRRLRIVPENPAAGAGAAFTVPRRFRDRLGSAGGRWKVEAPSPPADSETAAEPEAGRAAPGEAGIRWVKIPGGSFVMGDDQWATSKPRHRVTVKSFELAKTEVTNKQYKACDEAGACEPAHLSDGKCLVYNGADWKWGRPAKAFLGDDHPVVCVDWAQARAFARWVGGRLPSEAEWEYAARSGGKDRKYPWGDEEATCERVVMDEGGMGCGRDSTWPVCSKEKGNTEQGLCDMAGNAEEWVEDLSHWTYDGAPTNGSAWTVPGSNPFFLGNRVLRGDSWRIRGAANSRTADRGSGKPDGRDFHVGFRVAR